MSFSVHLDDVTLTALEDLAERTGKTRNALIKVAVTELIERERRSAWPESVRAFLTSGTETSDLTPFETHRAELVLPREPRL